MNNYMGIKQKKYEKRQVMDKEEYQNPKDITKKIAQHIKVKKPFSKEWRRKLGEAGKGEKK